MASEEPMTAEYRVRWADDHVMPADSKMHALELIEWRARVSMPPVATIERRHVGPWREIASGGVESLTADEPPMLPSESSGQMFSRWFTDWPSTHVNAGQSVEVLPVSEHEEALALVEKAWDTEVESANSARAALIAMQAKWSTKTSESKQHVEKARIELARAKADLEALRASAQALLDRWAAEKPGLSTRMLEALAALRAALAVSPSPPQETTEEADDWPHWVDAGPTVGYCSKCGEAREAFYTCRDGGETIPKTASDEERVGEAVVSDGTEADGVRQREATDFSVLAWEIARRAEWEARDGGTVHASVWVGHPATSRRERIYGVGPTATEAMRDLAVAIDRWAAR